MHPHEILQSLQTNLGDNPDAVQINEWIAGITVFCKTSAEPRRDFLTAESNLNDESMSFIKGASIVATAAFGHSLEKQFLKSMQQLSDLTEIAAFRFTAAWIAFNADDFDTCINECIKIEDHGYHVFGLMGQAQLESGDPHAAIDTLNIAVKMNDQDAALWFQLSKAWYVAGKYHEAWNSLDSCVRVGGQGTECAIMKCAIAGAASAAAHVDSEFYRNNSAEVLRNIFRKDANKPLLVIYAAKNALLSDSEDSFIEEMAYFLNPGTQLYDGDLAMDIAGILRQLQAKQWFDGAQLFLSIITGESSRDDILKS